MTGTQQPGQKHYWTIAQPVTCEDEVKRSRFLCHLAPAADESAARSIIAAVSKEHPQAGHHCTAFILGADSHTRRSNDDGEPSGTAGGPMLEVLAHGAAGEPLTDVVAVVSRWFGGVLLGSGGLIRAYSAAVKHAVAQAQLVKYANQQLVTIQASHAAAAKLEHSLRSAQIIVTDTSYQATDVTLRLALSDGQHDTATHLVREILGHAVPLVPAGSQWVPTSS